MYELVINYLVYHMRYFTMNGIIDIKNRIIIYDNFYINSVKNVIYFILKKKVIYIMPIENLIEIIKDDYNEN